MQFTKRLREGVRRGEITCSVRIWMQPRVKPGGRYQMGEGFIEVESIAPIEIEDITPRLARDCGFDGVVDLLKTAKHGRGTNVYLVRFHYVPSRDVGSTATQKKAQPAPSRGGQRPSKRVADRLRRRVVRILEQLPEAAAVGEGEHRSLVVRNKRFGYLLVDHHGDGRIALNCKGSPDVRDMLEQCAPAQLHVPKYLGSRGWIGLWLDDAGLDWSAVELVIREAYAQVAPKLLLRKLKINR